MEVGSEVEEEEQEEEEEEVRTGKTPTGGSWSCLARTMICSAHHLPLLAGLISGIRNVDSHFNGNNEASDLRNRLPQVAPVWPTNVPVNSSVVNRKKGLLSSFYTIAEKLLVFCGSLVILSLSYPLAANAKKRPSRTM
nr:unnamed protein product [Digitaria exilis]